MNPRRRDLGQLIDLEELFELGYDSDGFEGPFFDAVDAEGEQDFDEDSLDETTHTSDITEDDIDLNINPVGTN